MTNREIRAKARQNLGGGIFRSPWLLALVVCFISSTISGIAGSLFLIPLYIITGALSVGLITYFLRNARGEDNDISTLFVGFTKGFVGNMVLGLMIMLFVFLWGLIPVAGTILSIVKSYSYSMAYYVKADHPEYSWSRCLDESKRLMDGHKWKLFCLDLSFIGWILLSFVTFGLSTFWVTPYMQASKANFYRDLIGDVE